ncbi:MAG: transglutaminase family protein [Pirellulaceae bacterium]
MRRWVSFVCFLLLPALAWCADDLQDRKVSEKSDRRSGRKADNDEKEGPEFGETLANGIRFGNRQTQRWKVGLIITAPAGPCGGVYGAVPVPTDWPEQQVKVVAEDISPHVKEVEYRTLQNGVKQMLVSIPLLNAGETAQALVTFEVTKHAILPPEDPSLFVLAKKPSREFAPFLGSSPMIESTSVKIKNLAKEIVKDKEQPWQQVEAIYDYVREHVEYKDGPLKGALAALRDGNGDCEELTSLFIALCRALRIPARTVWVHGHCYPEFYLEDGEGQGHWIPCQAAGTRDFGGIPDTRPILQKGDNYRVPEKKEPQRYVAEFLSVKSVKGAGKPTVKFVRELLPAN